MARQSTRGHALLRTWLRSRAARGNRRDDTRPDFPAIRAFMVEINAEVEEDRRLNSPFAIYDWIEGSQNPQPPGRRWRDIIERLSGGTVPAGSWDDNGDGAEAVA